MSSPRLVLYHFAFSHYNEKVRWALDHKGLAHQRVALVPGAHVPLIKRLTGKTQVPVLLYNGEVIADSARIIDTLETRHPGASLYPADPAERARALDLAAVWDREIGPHVRRVAYFAILDDSAFVIRLMSPELSRLQLTGLRVAFPALRAIMRRSMQIHAEGAARSQERLNAALDRIAAEVRPSGYLAGDAFSVADLTAAALLAPITHPPELEHPYPAGGPLLWEGLKASLQSHPACAWAREVYRKHRTPPGP